MDLAITNNPPFLPALYHVEILFKKTKKRGNDTKLGHSFLLIYNCAVFIYRVFTIHGSEDEIIPVEDALEFAKLIPNHKLHIVEGANHCYSAHQQELASLVVDFLKSNQVIPTGKENKKLPSRL